jgi:hypothetical protein
MFPIDLPPQRQVLRRLESVREGPDETLTVLTLNLSARLRRSLATAESLLSRTRYVKRNVKRWRSGPSLDMSSRPISRLLG